MHFTRQVCSVNTLLTLIGSALKGYKEGGVVLNDVKYERIFLFCMAWALGGLLEQKERPMFDQVSVWWC